MRKDKNRAYRTTSTCCASTSTQS